MKFSFFSEEDKNKLMPPIVIGFIVRLIFLIEIVGTPFYTYLFSEPKIFDDTAKLIISNSVSSPDPFLISPLYIFFLAIFKLIFSDSNYFISLLQIVLNTFSIVFIYLSAKNIFNQKIAVISAWISAIFISFIFYSALIVPETILIFCISVLIYLLSDANKLNRSSQWIFIGIIFGLISISRSYFLFFIPLFIFSIIIGNKFINGINIKKIKLISFFLIGTLIIILPITLRNLIVTGELVFVDSSLGINFYLANNSDSEGIFKSPDNFDYEKDLSGKNYAYKVTGEKFTDSQASKYWFNRTLKEIINDPFSFSIKFFRKLFLFFSSSELPSSSMLDLNFYEMNYSNLLKLPFISYGLISLFSLVGLIFYIKEKNKNYFILLFTVLLILVTSLFFVNMQFRLSISPILIMFSAFGLYQIYNFIISANLKSIYPASIFILFYLIINYFIFKIPQTTQFDAYQHLGNVASQENRYEEAIYNYNRSIMLEDRYSTFLSLGNTFAKKKDFNNALAAYSEAEKRNAGDYLLYFNKGFVYSQINDFPKSLESYQKSLQLNPKYFPIYRSIGILYFVSQQYESAKYYFKKYLELSNDEITKSLVREDLKNIELKIQGK